MAIDKNMVMREARKFVEKGQYDKAIAEWKKLLSETPNDANLYNTIGDLCLKKDSKAEAVEAYKKAADLLASDGFTSKAIALYKKTLNIDPKKIEVHLALGDLNAEKGLTGNALESYKVAADHYVQRKDTVKALGIYQKMADLNPANVSFRVKLGDMYAKEGMTAEAAKSYLDAADAHLAKDAFKEARQLFEKILAIDPGNMTVYFKAGTVYLKEGKFGEACKALKPAFDADPANRELADAYLEALVKAGKDAEAEQAIKKVLDGDPGRTELREKLYRICLAKSDFEKALEAASALAGARVAAGDHDGAEALLKEFVSSAPDFFPARRRLSEFYVSAGRARDAAETLLDAAKKLFTGGNTEAAREALQSALKLAPGLKEAQELLDRLVAPPPPEPERVAPPAAPVAHEPPAAEPAAAAIEKPSFEEPAREEPASAAKEVEDPAVMEALTEVDVLIKYGLSSKAAEQLEGLARRFPESAHIRIKLRDVYGDLGQMSRAAAHMLVLAELYTRRGMQDQALQVLQSAQGMDPKNTEIMSRLGIVPAAEEIAPPEVQPAETPPISDVPFPTEEVLPALDQIPPFSEPSVEGEIILEGFDAVAPGREEEAPAAEPVREQASGIDTGEIWAEAEFYFQQGLFEEAKKYYTKILDLVPGEKRAIGRIAEIDREEEETREFSKLAEAVEGLEGALPHEPAERELPLSESDEDAVRSLMSEIAQLNVPHKTAALAPFSTREKSAGPLPPSVPPSVDKEAAGAPFEAAKPPAEEDFFDLGAELAAENKAAAQAPPEASSSDDFFDLAAELRDDLSGAAAPARQAGQTEEQSLDEIFEEFKRGVEQQSVKEDIDTHYNLGVAYKEMGLLDDAIGEFILTPEDEPKFILSRYMLGLCYMEKGEYPKAIGEIQNAIDYAETMGDGAQNLVGMRYDLGLAFQGAGNVTAAQGEFQKVAHIDPQYRDTGAKLKELQQGDFISLDQLKYDIEREISAKFFEEGERIEREEKTRRNEKVKN
jgi:tetratricopeptide (TPR) repeat protein